MVDYGRNLKPDGRNNVPLSLESPLCPLHAEGTPGGTFNFPPRTQPMHSARRAIIAAISVVQERNRNVPENLRDWVSIISYDKLDEGGPRVLQPLTGRYPEAMQASTRLQEIFENVVLTPNVRLVE